MSPGPRDSPALERSKPGDTTPGRDHGYVPSRETWTCLFGDGSWRNVSVRAWRKDDAGRQLVTLAWFHEPDGSMYEETFVDDPDRLEDPDPGEPTASPRVKA